MADAESTLSATQLQTLALISRRRQAGILPTADECDFLIDLVNQLVAPGHTCCDRESLACIACEGVTYDA